MRTRALLNAALIAVVSIFFMSGCGFFKQESRRIITDTHWGGTEGPSLAQKAKPAPKPQPAPEPEAEATEEGEDAAEGAEGAEKAEGTEAADSAESDEVADTERQATASTANIGSAAPQTSGEQSMTLYVAYQEAVTSKNLLTGDQSGVLMKSQVRICKLQEDNSLQCDESKELNQMLNPHLQYKSK